MEGGAAGLVFAEGEKFYEKHEGRSTNNVHVGEDMALGAAGGGIILVVLFFLPQKNKKKKYR
jgi:hypothetical protein